MNKVWHIYKLEYYSAVEKWHHKVCRQIDGTRNNLHDLGKYTQKDKYGINSLTRES